jgi:hypothetical protein
MSFDSQTLFLGKYCLAEISKNIDGELVVLDRDQKTCPNPVCDSLTLVQSLRLNLHSNHCNSSLGGILEGMIRVWNLTTVFAGTKETLRGVHAGSFYWVPVGGGTIQGTLEGITNAGTARSPVFPNCQTCERCDQVGLLTGHLFATGTNTPGIPVPDFNIEAVYRFAWDPIATIHKTAPVTGTLEGVLLMPCQ